jgi:hypothetical protein
MWIYRENDTSMASVENSSLELADGGATDVRPRMRAPSMMPP